MSNFQLSKIRENIKDVVRSNRFLVSFENFSNSKDYFGKVAGGNINYQYLVNTISLPTATNSQQETSWFGLQSKYAGGDMTIEQVAIDFNVDSAFEFRRGMEEWFFDVHNPIENKRQLVTADIKVVTYTSGNEPLSEHVFIGCFPINISAASVSQSDMNSFLTCNASFSVQDFTAEFKNPSQ